MEAGTFVDVVRRRAARRPDAVALTFLDGDMAGGAVFTYADLDRRARAVGAILQREVPSRSRVLLIHSPGLEFVAAFFGCLYAGMIAVPAQAPRHGRANRRIATIVTDAAPAMVLGDARPRGADAADTALAGLPYLATSAVDDADADAWTVPAATAATIALLQYTSGSTSTPRGVMVTHGNLLYNSECIKRAFLLSECAVSASWLPAFHDMGLVDGILQPLYTGFPAYLMAPASFVQAPLRWLQAISKYHVTHSGGPNSGYALCVRRSTPQQREGLDLSSWTTAYNGAEPIHRETLEAFTSAFAPHGFRSRAFYPCYGLAEATLMVTGGSIGDEPVYFAARADDLEQHRVVEASAAEQARTLVGCGHPPMDTQIAIVDAETARACPPDRVGEIWVRGPGVTSGYWMRPEATTDVFAARCGEAGDGPFLRTGDLGFFASGQLFVTGRRKDLFIVHGRNHYPQDVEFTAERAHTALSPGSSAVFVAREDGADQVVFVGEIGLRHPASTDVEAIAAAVREAAFDEHDLRIDTVVLVGPAAAAKTSSGKIERHTMAADYAAARLREVGRSTLARGDGQPQAAPIDRAALARMDRAERRDCLIGYVADCVREWLGRSIAPDLRRSLAALGCDSMRALELSHRFESQLGVSVPPPLFMADGGIEAIAAHLEAALSAGPPPEPARAPATTDGDHPLSAGQEALWFLQQLAPDSTADNVSIAVRVHPAIAVERWSAMLRQLVQRHAALRTVVAHPDGGPVQRVLPQMSVDLAVVDLVDHDPAATDAVLAAAAGEPFDLQSGPLFRAQLYRRHGGDQILLLCAHHVIVDLWSASVLLDELQQMSAAFTSGLHAMPQPERQCADHAYWQQALLAGPDGERQWRYWQRVMADAPPLSEFPADRGRSSASPFRGGVEACDWDDGLATRLRTFAAGHAVSLYVALLAAYRALAYRYTGEPDFVVGISTAGRDRAAFAGTVGYLVNQLPLRVPVSGDRTCVGLLADVARGVSEALAHQDLPFALLVRRLQPERDPGATPIFQTMFVLAKAARSGSSAVAAGVPAESMEMSGVVLTSVAVPRRCVRFGLTVTVVERASGLTLVWEYDADRHDASTVRQMNRHLTRIAETMIADPERTTGSLPLLDGDERRMLAIWARTHPVRSGVRCVHEWFEEQAAHTPDATAIDDGGRALSYREVNAHANRLAHRLRARGVGPEVVVGIAMRRSPEVIVAMLAVLKAGGAYLPLDPAYPAERLAYMVADARALLCVTDHTGDAVLPTAVPRLCLEHDRHGLAMEPAVNPAGVAGRGHLAYVIYTSGSTGRPKGVMVEHAALLSYLAWSIEAYRLSEGCGVPLNSSIGFDATITAIFPPLLTGKTVFILPEADELAALCAMVLSGRPLSLVKITPAHLRLLQRVIETDMAERPVHVGAHAFVVGGEALPADLARFWRALAPRTRLINEYGPTETVVGVCAHEIDDVSVHWQTVPIGRPIAGAELLVLDQHMEHVPVGVAGELYIGGGGVARGYLERPVLTAEAFVPHPSGDGRRLYHTGDIVRYMADGTLEFIGRRDTQVNLRGYRIELGEIEAVLCRHDAVREVAVVVSGSEPSAVLAACVVVRRPVDGGVLERFAALSLPRHMVPSAVMVMDALPRTAHGKIDRRRLAELSQTVVHRDTSSAEPATELEQDIATAWRAVLHVDRVGRHDNFFDAGGHSLLAVLLQRRLTERLARPVSVLDVLRYPTVAALANRLGRGREGLEGASARATVRADRQRAARAALRHDRPRARGRDTRWQGRLP